MSAHTTCSARIFRVFGCAGFFQIMRYYTGRTKADAKTRFLKEFSQYNDVKIKKISILSGKHNADMR